MPRQKQPPKNASESALARFARERLAVLEAGNKGSLGDLPLFDFLVKASPHLRRPEHLSAVLPYLEAIREAPQAFALSAPPRHGKSVLIQHLCAREMIARPGIRIAYGSYNLDLAGFCSTEVKDILISNNVEIDKNHKSKEEWRLENGSTFKCVAPGSGFTGRGADLIIIDDPYKGRLEAESGRIRDATWNWFTAVAITRRSPKASVIINHTRWVIDDLAGKATKEHGWPYINLPAIDEDGMALWPEEWPTEKLDEIREIIGAYEWSSLYMGEPRPRGGTVFGDPTAYTKEELPKTFKKVYIGIDAAYTKKTHSDYSVAVVIGQDDEGVVYVLDVIRKQCEAPVFGKLLQQLRHKYGCPPIYWSIGGIERAVVDFFESSCGVPIKAVPAKEDKFVRAQAVAAAWNAGRVRLPSSQEPWVGPFLSEVLLFTGLDDPHDDCVDALAAAFIPCASKRVKRGNLTERVMSF